MRIVTPQNAAFDPSGGGSDGVIQYQLSETVNADFGPTDDLWFTPTVDGVYSIAAFIICTASDVSGALDTQINQPGGVGLLAPLTPLGLIPVGNYAGIASYWSVFLVAGGAVYLRRQVAGLAASASYRISYSAVLAA